MLEWTVKGPDEFERRLERECTLLVMNWMAGSGRKKSPNEFEVSHSVDQMGITIVIFT